MGEITPYAQILYNELKKQGIKSILEFNDGHKSVDIFIPEANLIIEVDGSHHGRSEQAFRDLVRDTYSLQDGKVTIHLPNSVLFDRPFECAKQIKIMVQKRVNEKEQLKQSLENISRYRMQLEEHLRRATKIKTKEQIEHKIIGLSKKYELIANKLKKFEYVKEKLGQYYNFSKIALTYATDSLKYLGWAFLILPLIFWIFKISILWSVFFLKLFSILIVLRIVLYVSARFIHYRIVKRWRHLKTFQKILEYIAGAFLVISFAIWIFKASDIWALFFMRSFVVLVALIIITKLDENII